MTKKLFSKARIRKHRTRLNRARKHPFVVPVVTFIALFFITIVAVIGFSATTIGPTDTRIISLYVDGKHETIPTRARTVGELLERREIKLNKGDIVEPKQSTEILEDNFSVNIYRARPVSIKNGKKKVTVLSAAQSPRGVAADLGIKLEPEDVVKTSAPEQVLSDGLITEQLEVLHSVPVKLVLYGASYSIRTVSKTVGELMKEKGIDVTGASVFPKKSTKLKADSVVFVTYPGKKIVIREKRLPFRTQTVTDDSLAAGTIKVKQAGHAGKQVTIFEIDKKNPKIKKILQRVITSQPEKRIVARGTKPTNTLTGGKAQWLAGAGISSSDYGYVDYIISRESGWNPAAVNANRCIGLGQKCDAGSLIAACPNWQTDPVCQLRVFTGYAEGRYGSWGGAYNAWQVQGWW